MDLEYKLDTLEDLDDAYHSLYSEQDGLFLLRVQNHPVAEDKNKIPKSRLDQEIAKRKTAEENLTSVAEALKSGIPEEYRDLIPAELPPAAMIKWINKMNESGIFDSKASTTPLDNKRPATKPAVDLEGLPPQAKMAMGYKKT